MSKKRILVTGAGALLGQGILRCLQPIRQDYHIVTVDPDHRSSGFFLSDMAYTIPLADEQDYLQSLIAIIKREKIELIFIGTDVELPLLSNERINLEKAYQLKIAVSRPEVIAIANDKWLTANFLRDNGFPFPVSVRATDGDGIHVLRVKGVYPLFAKPRDGARSKGIRVLNNEFDLAEIEKFPSNLVIQEFLEESEGEFTAGCLVFGGKCCAVVVLKRDLRDGNTWRAYSDISKKYEPFLMAVAEKLGAEGPCNFQFRIRANQPVIFEINARFSGTTPLRMIFGFNEVKATLNYYLNGVSDFDFKIAPGTVLRTFSDLFISNEQMESLKLAGELKQPEGVDYPFSILKS